MEEQKSLAVVTINAQVAPIHEQSVALKDAMKLILDNSYSLERASTQQLDLDAIDIKIVNFLIWMRVEGLLANCDQTDEQLMGLAKHYTTWAATVNAMYSHLFDESKVRKAFLDK